MNASPSFPPLDGLISALRQIDWRAVAHRLIMIAATICAVAVALTLFAHKHARRFWAEHGDEITLHALAFADRVKVAAIVAANTAATITRAATPVITQWANRALDSAFYELAAF